MASPTEPAMPVEYLTTARLSEKDRSPFPKPIVTPWPRHGCTNHRVTSG